MDPVNPEKARRFVERCQHDLAFHIEHVQGVKTLEPFQRRICKAVTEHERVAVSACHDVGKTFTLSKIVLAVGSVFEGAKIITTAPTFLQVRHLLWSEINTGFRNSVVPLGGEMLLTQWKIRPDWFALGFSPRKEAGADESQGTASSFQGFHGGLVVIVFDEATGIPKQIWDQAEGMLTSAHVKFIAIGNPTSRNSEFYRCFSNPTWFKIRLSCFDSPNLIANGITNKKKLLEEIARTVRLPEADRLRRLGSYKVVQPKLLTVRWVIQFALKNGVDHPLFVSKALGEFPEDDDHALITLGTIEEAQRREFKPNGGERVSLGVDVARFGSDKTVITQLRGRGVEFAKILVKRDTNEVSGEVIQLARQVIDAGLPPRSLTIAVDATGIGSGVVDNLRAAQREGQIPSEVSIIEVHFGSGFDPDSPDGEADRAAYVNLKAKVFVELAKALKENMCLPQDQVYLEELPTLLYRFDSKGRYVMESKEEYKKRTGRPSPDHADSLAIALHGMTVGASGRFEAQDLGSTIVGSSGLQW